MCVLTLISHLNALVWKEFLGNFVSRVLELSKF